MGHDIDEARIRNLLDAVYGAAVAPETWPLALARLADVFSGGFVDIFTRSRDRRHFSGLAYGMDRSDYDDNFLGFWFKRNVWGTAKPVEVAGEVLSTRQMVDPALLRRSEMFNHYLDARGLHEGLRLSLWAGEHEVQDISILRPWSGGAYGPAEVALGEALLPHLQRAAAVTRRLREAEFQLRIGDGGTGLGGIAAFAFDRHGAPFWFNAAAEAVLIEGEVLSLMSGDLHARTAPATRKLRRTVDAALGRSDAPPTGGTVTLPREGGTGTAHLMVLPMASPGDWATSRPPAAVALLRNPATSSLSRDRLCELFRLTSAEADLARHLLDGRSLRDVAALSGRSLNTVRSHLAHLMDKTETSRQADLVRLLGDVAALSSPGVRAGPAALISARSLEHVSRPASNP